MNVHLYRQCIYIYIQYYAITYYHIINREKEREKHVMFNKVELC